MVNNFRLPGQYFDEETGFHYNYHRYYDPGTGRYLTPDPIGQEGGINLFLYAMNNPINAIDPLGLKRKCGESFGSCVDRCLQDNYGWMIDVADNLGWYGLAASATALGTSAFTNIIEGLAAESIKNDAIAASLTGGNILQRSKVANVAAKRAVRKTALKATLGAAGKYTGLVGAFATGFSLGARGYCASQCIGEEECCQ